MTYELMQSCVGVSGVSQANCAGWVQAWGSIIGLAIAIGVPLWQRREERQHTRRVQEATADVVAAGALMTNLKSMGIIDGLIARFEKHKENVPPEVLIVDLAQYLDELETVPETTLLNMTPIWPGPVKLIAQAHSHMQIAITAIDALQKLASASKPVRVDQIQFPMNLLVMARNDMAGAHALIRPNEPPLPTSFRTETAKSSAT